LSKFLLKFLESPAFRVTHLVDVGLLFLNIRKVKWIIAGEEYVLERLVKLFKMRLEFVNLLFVQLDGLIKSLDGLPAKLNFTMNPLSLDVDLTHSLTKAPERYLLAVNELISKKLSQLYFARSYVQFFRSLIST